MLSIVYPYRNRDLSRIKNSLDSLKNQSVTNFEVFFVDYGSRKEYSREVEKICDDYPFVHYKNYPTQYQPWNKSRALNSIISRLSSADEANVNRHSELVSESRLSGSKYCFVADVDIIFHPEFVKKAIQLQEDDKTIYFQVGFLDKESSTGNKNFQDQKNFRRSSSEATGLTMFPVRILQKLKGFDEFYHFWGAEDTDMHARIKNAKFEVEFYDKEILLLHQWHPSYRSTEKSELTKEPQISGVVQLNHQHLKFAIQNKVTTVNSNGWGNCLSPKELEELEQAPLNLVLNNEKRKIDDFLFGQLPNFCNRIVKVKIEQDPFQYSLKYKAKKRLGKKVPQYYSLKEINDKFLLHLISFYRDFPYCYKVSEDLESFEISIKFP